jgi:ATP-dependent DNA ligase
LTDQPLYRRRAGLQELVNEADDQGLQFSLGFDDPAKLLAAAERMDLEGIVSKRRTSLYRSGPSRDWIKAKTAGWRARNADRHRLSEQKPSTRSAGKEEPTT